MDDIERIGAHIRERMLEARREANPAKNPVIESMTKVVIGSTIVIRVWREETEIRMWYSDTISEVRKAIDKVVGVTWHIGDEEVRCLVQSICELPRINAVEVVVNGDGVVFYPDWK